MNKEYQKFLNRKSQLSGNYGFDPVFIPDYLFDFQKYLVEWALKKGRGAVFADCGLGKTPMQLVWAENIVRKTNKNVLILTPLAVSDQTLREAEKFSIECERSRDGRFNKKIIITNYERRHYFNRNDFIGVACDESSIFKNFDAKTRIDMTDFMKKIPYRSLWTATAAPNDYIELGSSSEVLGELGHMDVLNRFFKNVQNTCDTKGKWKMQFGKGGVRWRFKGHAEQNFWRWVSSWARVIRKPSDLGFDDNGFILPELIEIEHVIKSYKLLPGFLFVKPASNFREERFERKNTIKERCEKAAELVYNDKPAVIWCHLNPEGDLLEKIIHDSVQVSGRDNDEKKEEAYINFSKGKIRVLITKPKIGSFGLNWQHCNNVITFASHSYESYYQLVRRCWRFGQKNKVVVNIVLSEGETRIRENINRKAKAADDMFSSLIKEMNNSYKIDKRINFDKKEILPRWL